jgi:predicted O-methyltransferase YrrM
MLSRVRAAYRRHVRRSRDPRRGPAARRLERQLARARAAWLEQMAEFRTDRGLVRFPADPALEQHHLVNCRVLPHRRALLDRMKRGAVAAEVGVETGQFSEAILDSCQPSQLHLLDLDLKRFGIRRRFSDAIAAGIVQLHEGDSALTLRTFADASFDFIYIDGDHSYDGVKLDIEAARMKVKPDGFLIFNDYTYWSPAEALRYGVIAAVNELCLADDWEVVYFALAPLMYCDVALRRRGAAVAPPETGS